MPYNDMVKSIKQVALIIVWKNHGSLVFNRRGSAGWQDNIEDATLKSMACRRIWTRTNVWTL